MTEEKKKRTRRPAKPSNENVETPEAEVVSETMHPQEQPAENPEVANLEAEEVESLKTELSEAQSKCKEYFEGWQRERADFVNYKKRVDRDQTQLHQVITANIIKKFLTIQDDMARAIKNKPDGVEANEWWSGVELIFRKLQGILEAEGVQPIAHDNDDFDPNRHEAISHEDHPDIESGKVIEVVQQGYAIGDRVIRPAMVRVAR